jgi:putative DNA primase/helicase
VYVCVGLKMETKNTKDAVENKGSSFHADLARSGLAVEDVPNFRLLNEEETRRKTGHRVPSYAIGYLDADGRPLLVNGLPHQRIRFLDKVEGKNGKAQRYFTAPGDLAGGVHVYIPAGFLNALRKSQIPVLFITEGEKKAEAACKAGIACVALPGIWMFQDLREKERIRAVRAIELKNEIDAAEEVRNNPYIPLSGEIIDIVRLAIQERPALAGVCVLYDEGGFPLDGLDKDIFKAIKAGDIEAYRRPETWLHPATRKPYTVLNAMVAQAAWLLGESLRVQLPEDSRLPVLHDFCPPHLVFSAGEGDEQGKKKKGVFGAIEKNGLDDWLVRDGAGPVLAGLRGIVAPIFTLADLVSQSELFGTRADPALMAEGASGKSESGPSPDKVFNDLLDGEYVGMFDEIIHVWKKTHWQAVSTGELRNAASAFLTAVKPAKMVKNSLQSIVSTAPLAPHLYRIPEIQRNDPVRIALLDAVVEVRDDGEIVEVVPDRRHGLRHGINALWADHDQPTPMFDAFIEKVLPDEEVRRVVLEYIGYTLLPDTRFQVAQFWVGSGANGKSVLAEIVAAMHRKVATLNLRDLGGFSTTALIGASLIDIDEMPPRIDEQALKSMISGDPTFIDRKYLEPVSIRPTAKWIMRGNAAPQISDQSDGFWRRLHVVQFPTQFPEGQREVNLAKKIIEAELSGILYRVLKSLSNLLQRGRFGELPDKMTEAVEQMRIETNSLRAWLENVDMTIVPDLADGMTSAAVYANYNEWCKQSGYMPVAVQKFWTQMGSAVKGVVRGSIRMCDEETGESYVSRRCNIRVGASVDAPVASTSRAGALPFQVEKSR